jgi:hypothetical protein
VQNQANSDSLQQLLEMPRKSWWARLPFGVRMTAGTSALLILIGGGAATVAIMTKDEPRAAKVVAGRGSVGAAPANPGTPSAEPAAAAAALGGGRPAQAGGNARGADRNSSEADRTATRTPRQPGTAVDQGEPQAGPVPAAPAPAAPGATAAVTTRTVSETRAIPYRTRLVRDPGMPRGERRVETEGIDGEEMLRWLVTLAGGRQTERRLIDSTVTREPQHRVIVFGSQGMGPGRGPGRGHGHWPGRGPRRECRQEVGACLPFGRNACPTQNAAADNPADQPNSAQPRGGETAARRARAGQGAARVKPAQADAAVAGKAQTGGSAAKLAQAADNGAQLGNSIMVTDEDLALLTPEDLGAMGIDPRLLCP